MMLFVTINLSSQDNPFIRIDTKPKIKIAVLRAYNWLNDDDYMRFRYDVSINNSEIVVHGIRLELQYSTKYNYLDVNFGSLLLLGGNYNWGFNRGVPGVTSVDDYILNGGGVYCALSPKIKGRFFGLTSDFGVGIFSFKEYTSIYNNRDEPYVDIHDLKASNGLGAISSVGMYLNIGRIGINPSVFAIFSGGAQASFTFFGFELPITYQF